LSVICPLLKKLEERLGKVWPALRSRKMTLAPEAKLEVTSIGV
jgi:hypothetical protein